jgi:hypothetical protein
MYEKFLKEKRYLTGCTEKTLSIYAQAFKRYGPHSGGQDSLMILLSVFGKKDLNLPQLTPTLVRLTPSCHGKVYLNGVSY